MEISTNLYSDMSQYASMAAHMNQRKYGKNRPNLQRLFSVIPKIPFTQWMSLYTEYFSYH